MQKRRESDIDAKRRALRTRMGSLSIVNSDAPPPTTLPAHKHAAIDISFEPYGHVASTNVQDAIEELDNEKLARDGSQTMLGALDMNHFDVDNVLNLEVEVDATVGQDLTVTRDAGIGRDATVGQDATVTRDVGVGRNESFSGGVGEAIVSGVRAQHMAGVDGDSEGLIDGLERVVFNDKPAASVIELPSVVEFNPAVRADVDITPKRGSLSFDTKERMLVTWFESVGNGVPRLHKIPIGWVVLQCIRGENGGSHLAEGTLVFLNGVTLDYNSDGETLPEVDPATLGDTVPLLTDAHKIQGITLGIADREELVPVMRRGRWHTASGGWTPGDLLFANPGLVVGDPGGGVRVFVGTVLFDDGMTAIVDVDVQVMPTLGELSLMETVTPDQYFVPVFDTGSGHWTPGLLPAVGVTFDATATGISDTDVQHAIDDLAGPTPAGSTITLGTPAGTTQSATIQLANGLGDLAFRRLIRVYLASDAAGTPSSAGAATSVTVSTGDVLKLETPKLDFEIVTDASGVAVLSFDNAGGGGTYTDRLALVLPTGLLLVSAPLAVPN